jgi:uncharacterized protein YggE
MLIMSSVTVRGAALASVTPDRAELSLALSHLAADAAAALDQVSERSHRLETMLAGLGFERIDWATEGVQVAEEYVWKNDSNVLVGHRATTAVTVTIRSIDLVGTVIRDGVTGVGATIRNLVWRVDADNPVRRTLLGDAARDARLRATAYVEALGLHLGEVDLVSEVAFAPETPPAPREMMMAGAAKMADSGEISVSGGLVELSAEVYVRFAILP